MLTKTKATLVKPPAEKDARKPAGMNGPFYPQLNGLRFVFIFMVLLHHWGPQTLTERYRIGWTGVDLFFVLSGFLIGEILLREKEATENKSRSVRRFIMRRALRIFPLYYTAVLLYSFFSNDGGMLIYNLTYTNNIFQAFHLNRVPEDFWHIWSLCVEEQFYLLFPFLLFFVNRRYLPPVLIAGILFSVAGRVYCTWMASMPDPHILTPFCLDSLFLGVLLAYLKIYKPAFLLKLLRNQTTALAGVAASFTALFLLCYFNNDILVYGFLRFFGAAAGFLLIGYSVMKRFTGPLKALLENRLVSLFGKISYGIYLLHPFVERIYYRHLEGNAVRNFFIRLNKPVVSNRYVIDFVTLFIITIAISYFSFQYFEKRFLKLKRLYT